MSIPVTVNGFTFNFLADPTAPNGWDIQPVNGPGDAPVLCAANRVC